MKMKLMSLLLAFAIIISCCSPMALALELTNEEFYILDAERHHEMERLFELRATLEQNFDDNIEEIARIDLQLEQLGVEELSATEVSAVASSGVAPMVIPEPQDYVKYYEERTVTVYNGEQYELQIVTSVPTSSRSALCPSYGFHAETEGMQIADNIEFCATTAEGLIGFYANIASGGVVSQVTDSISHAFTFYDIYNSYIDAITSTTVIDGVECSGLISLAIHEKHIFIKSYGSPDWGYQIMPCISNRVSYEATVLTEGELIVNGVAQANVDSVTFDGVYYSQYYGDVDLDFDGVADLWNDRSDLTRYVSKVFWEYRKYGRTDFLIDHRVKKLRFDWTGGDDVVITIPHVGFGMSY